MRGTAQVILDFLANAAWQVTAVALVATLGNYLLRSFTRARHVVWVAALVLSFLLPLLTSLPSYKGEPPRTLFTQLAITEPVTVTADWPAAASFAATEASPGLHIGEKFALILLAAYLALVAYRSFKLIRAGLKTRATRKSATLLIPEGNLSLIVEQCQQEFGITRVTMLASRSLHTAATTGVFSPSIILPEELLRAGDDNALAAAVGHEMVHIARRDYLLNLIYELIFLPLSFHPAAALMKRRITQTRELRCDEVVSERLLHPEVYARSLVRLAGLAIPFTRRAQTMIVGISDADILEVRIMSLLKRTKSNLRRKAFLLIAAAILLALPAVVAASFAVHFKIDPAGASASAQEPSTESAEKKQREREEVERKRLLERQIQELKQAVEQAPNADAKARLEAELKNLMDEKKAYTVSSEGRAFTVKLDEEGQRREQEMKAKQDTELAKLARISMDQAIQIATSKTPGKVLECSLVGERWSAPGELAKPSVVLYHLVILSGDDANPVTMHVLVNAGDGSIVKTEREERRREIRELLPFNRTPDKEPLNGGVLNGKATNLPLPEYPTIAREARVTGNVNVEVLIDEGGTVVEAHSVSGHPLLQAAAVNAARQATFAQTRVNGEPVMVRGVITYNFLTQ